MTNPVTFLNSLLGKSLSISGLDYHVGFTMLQRAWMALASTMIAIAIPYNLTAQEQGYYFSFNSIIALQVFFELGLSFVVIQIFAHEMAHVRFSSEGQLTGPANTIKRIKSLFILLFRWYTISAILFAIIVIPSGYYFFKLNGTLKVSEWIAPWIGLAIFTALNLLISPLLAACEGMGKVGEIARLRLIQSIISTLAIVILLKLGLGLYVAPVGAFFMCIASTYWLFKNQTWLKPLLIGSKDQNIINWKNEIFPFQWRIAVSWLSGYFIFQIFAPIFFVFQGPEVAGQIGFCISIFSAITVLSLSWISANTPKLVKLINTSDRAALNKQFLHLFKLSLITYFFLTTVTLCLVAFSIAMNLEITKRILPLKTLIIIAAIFTAQQIISALALYVRSHKEEPFVSNSVLTAILFFLSLSIGGKYSIDIALFFCMCANLISLLLAWPTFKKFYLLKA